MHAGGKTVTDDLNKALFVKPDLADADPVGRVDTQDMQKAQQGADTLGYGGGNSGRAYAQAKSCNKEHIQTNVDKGREYQIIQGVLAVAYGMENTHENVVHDRKDGAAEVVTEIGNGLGEDLGRRSHPPQNDGGQRNAHGGQKRAGHQTKGDCGVNGAAHGVVLPCAKGPGDDYAGTHGNAVKEADHHEDQASGGADCRQSIIAYVIAYAPGVEGVV